jgi:uncharacterized integral membrane protein
MKTIVNLSISLILAIWLVAIAIIAIQNATPVALKFLFWRSIQIPLGLVMAFSVAIGLVVLAVIQSVWTLRMFQGDKSRLEDDNQFFVDDDDF